MPCFPRPLAISLVQPGPPQPQTAPPIFFSPLHTCLRVCLPCCAASPRCGRGCTASKRSGGATTRTHGVGHTPGRRPQALGSLMLAGVAMLHWFCTSALSTCGSVLLCSIVYYSCIHAMGSTCSPCNAACTQCRSSAVASMVGRSSMGERVVKHETMLAACVCLWPR